MAGIKKIRQEVKKEFNWYSSVAIPKEINDLQVFSRLQSLRSRLLEDSVLRVDADIRLFVVGKKARHTLPEDQNSAIENITKDVETVTFIHLLNVDSMRDIISIKHAIKVEKVSYRGDRVSVTGTMSLIVSYLSAVVLDGTVTDFSRGAPVKGAKVKVKDIDSGKTLVSTTTGPGGVYAFADINPGTFMVQVEAEGFQREERVAVVMFKDTVDFTLHKVPDDVSGTNLDTWKEGADIE